MTTASSRRPAGAAQYQRWQFATLTADSPVLRGTRGAERESEADPEPEVPMVSESERARIREAARAEGYAAGFGSGRADAAEAVAAEATHLRALVKSIDAARVALTDETAGALLALACDIAAHAMRAELRFAREAMLPAVREAIDLAGAGAHPQLLLNPGDVEFVRRHLGDELAAGHWRLSEDARIEPGGCRAATAEGAVDATLVARWRRASAALGVNPVDAGDSLPVEGTHDGHA